AFYRRNLTSFSPILASVVMFSMIANPFLLENLSYKFDVLPMLTSMSILLIPFSLHKHGYLSFTLSAIVVVASLSMYQASIAIFACLAVFEFCLSYKKNTEEQLTILIKKPLMRVSQLFLGYVSYYLISKDMIKGSYNITHSQTINFGPDGF